MSPTPNLGDRVLRSGHPSFPPLTIREALSELLFFATNYMAETIVAADNFYSYDTPEDNAEGDECIRQAEVIAYIFNVPESAIDAISIDRTMPEISEEVCSSLMSELLGESPCPPPTDPSVSSATSPPTPSSPSTTPNC